MARTHRAIAEAPGAVVDSTKIPEKRPCPTFRTSRRTHLVRDPRAVAHSWSKQKDYVHAMRRRERGVRQFNPASR
jgi:hypothetical protein